MGMFDYLKIDTDMMPITTGGSFKQSSRTES